LRPVTASVEHTIRNRWSHILVDNEALAPIGSMENGKDSDHWHPRVWIAHASIEGMRIPTSQQILILEPRYLFSALGFHVLIGYQPIA
jgi:hypothetical protein